MMLLLRSRPLTSLALAVVSLAFLATTKPSAELAQAKAAAAHARTLPGGAAYAQSVQRALFRISFEGTNCLGHYVGWRGSPGAEFVVVISKTGEPKWIIRDNRYPMANCILKKVIEQSFPRPPADNWPVHFGISSIH